MLTSTARPEQRQRWIIVAILGIILTVGAALRLFQLDHFPPGLYPDVAANGLNALALPHDFRVLYDRGPGNTIEGMIVWLEWPFRILFGRAPIFVYLTTVFIGLATIPIHYALARRLFTPRIALLSAALLCVSFWDVHYSRLGYRTLLMPLFLDLVFLSVLWASARGGMWRWIVAGAILGIGNYTYTSYRLIFLLLLLVVVVRWKRGHAIPGTRNERIAYITSATALSIPLALVALANPYTFFSRTDGVAVWNGPILELPVRLFNHIVATAALFNFSGDPERQYNVPHLPLFDPLVGIAFLIGLVVVWRTRQNDRYNLLLMWLGLFTLVVAFSDRTPHMLRGSGLIPAAYLVAAIGLDKALSAFRDARMRIAIATGVIALSTAWTGFFYFVVYPTVPQLYLEFTGDRVDLGKFIVTSNFDNRPVDVVFTYYPTNGEKPHADPFRAQPLHFETEGRVAWTFVGFSDIPHMPENSAVVIYDITDSLAANNLAARFPHGRIVDTIVLPSYHYAVFSTDGAGDFTFAQLDAYSNTS